MKVEVPKERNWGAIGVFVKLRFRQCVQFCIQVEHCLCILEKLITE